MKIISKKNYDHVFPMKIKCSQVRDEYGFSYGKVEDFCGSELEIDANDIKKHKWFKYPNYVGIDYGVLCPVCGKFIVIDAAELPNAILESAEEVSVRG